MLMLTIRPKGYVLIGDNIKIFNPEDHQIRVGFEAPREIPIVREEAKDKYPKK
jgi:carbon storage regulator CsrA